MTDAAAGREPIEHIGSGTTEAPADRCAFCGTIESYRYHVLNGRCCCAWCFSFRADLEPESPARPKRRRG